MDIDLVLVSFRTFAFDQCLKIDIRNRDSIDGGFERCSHRVGITHFPSARADIDFHFISYLYNHVVDQILRRQFRRSVVFVLGKRSNDAFVIFDILGN